MDQMKFHSIRIQNYKSINDITLYLSDVNLLIGPNNSGKSNILSALKLFCDYLFFLINKTYPIGSDFGNGLPHIKEKYGDSYSLISFTITFVGENLQYISLCVYLTQSILSGEYYISRFFRITNSEKRIENHSLEIIIEESEYIEIDDIHWKNKKLSEKKSVLFQKDVLNYNSSSFQGSIDVISANFKYEISSFLSASIYSLQVKEIKPPRRLNANENLILPDGSNLVSFLDAMSNTNPKVIQEMEKDLYRLTKEFQSIRLLKVTGESKRTTVLKKLGLADKDDNTFWSDQLSEGVLYFLALLAIIHQPNPPHLLMLEEPEKGIHPRRIKEIIELIFQIAKDKGIRVILTTHSTYVVDQFTEIPEGVHIVDKIDKSTQVKNLKRDFIDKEEGREDKIDYLSSLGEHWSIGFLGGVPE